jgi:hypothetical protein
MGACIVQGHNGKLFGVALKYDAVKDKFLVEFHMSKLKQWIPASLIKVRVLNSKKPRV